GALSEPRPLMRSGLGLIVLGHCSLVLGSIVHGSVLRHVSGARRSVTPEYAVANVVSVCSGLLSIAAGIIAILVSHNLSRGILVSGKGGLVWRVWCGAVPAAAAAPLGPCPRWLLPPGRRCGSRLCPPWGAPNASARGDEWEVPLELTGWDTALALWFPSLLLAAAEAVLSGRCCLVALLFQGIGPCAHRSCGKEQV
ncbi:KCP3 protein, partial [Zosterops hypoxanthus]|nr:KCP3 protein [Zosterops hypoxanthus]